jgi:hypothetical protein
MIAILSTPQRNRRVQGDSRHIRIEPGYLCAGTSGRHPGTYFFKSIRYVLRDDNIGSLWLAARALEILGSPPRHQSDVGPQPIRQQPSLLGGNRWRAELLKHHCGVTHRV